MATKEVKTEQEYDIWKEMVPVTLPRAPKGEQNFQFVCINGRTFQVPRTGKPVDVPRPVWDVLMRAEEAKEFAADRKGELSEMAEQL